ncbi:MAG: polymerase region [Gemmatimonadetes bacterium]|nr:polymerase region [Gemmatimonadota bacterium]
MLSHEPKNYALLGYDGTLILRGVAFRSSRAEPYGERFLRQAIARLLVGDVVGVRDVYVATVFALRARTFPTHDVSSRVRLTKSPAQYEQSRPKRRELAYEAILASGRTSWSIGERLRVYRRESGEGGLATSPDDDTPIPDRHDYDAEHYVRLLRTTYAERLARGFSAEDFAVVFADPEQFSLFAPSIGAIRTVLTILTPPNG